MSRYKLPTHDTTLAVIVGWDNPLQTFFGQVMRPGTVAHVPRQCVAWVGTEPQEIPTVADLCAHLHPYAALPIALQAQLARDQARSLPPSALQARLAQFLAQIEDMASGHGSAR